MRMKAMAVVAMAVSMVLASGCHKNTVDKSAFKSALNDYYKGK